MSTTPAEFRSSTTPCYARRIGTTWALDLDGVVWLADEPIAGAAAAVGRLRDAGHPVVFLTNNSAATVADYLTKLAAHDIPATTDDLVTSAQAAASMLGRGTSALVLGGPGVVEALEDAGVRVTTPDTAASATADNTTADAVVVGFHRDFDYERLTVAMRAIRAGARLIGTNDDATYPTPEGPIPGGGSILAAVAYASGATPTVAGKPNEPLAALVRRRVGTVATMVGDRPSTDGLFARRIGARFALVLSGVTTAAGLPVEPEPDVVAADLAALVDAELAPPHVPSK